MFADDTRIYGKVTNTHDVTNLQKDLERVYVWAEENKMEFNAEKFEIMRFGNNDPLKNCTSYTSPSGAKIQEKENLRDLGVIMSNSLKFNEHIGHTRRVQCKGGIFDSF